MAKIEQLLGLVIGWRGVLYDHHTNSVEPDAEFVLSRLTTKFGLVLASFDRDDTTGGRVEQIRASVLARYFRRVLIGHGDDEEVTLKYGRDVLGYKAFQTAVVSDSLTNDIWLAGKLGMQPIWMRHHFPGIKLPQEKVATGLLVAEDLKDLAKILGVDSNDSSLVKEAACKTIDNRAFALIGGGAVGRRRSR